MLYFRCIEKCLMQEDLLHFYDIEGAKQFLTDMMDDPNSAYAEAYTKCYGKTFGEHLEEAQNYTQREVGVVLSRGLKAYGYIVMGVDLDFEPHHLYIWSPKDDMWKIHDPDKETE